jgi:hypothetical protein
VTALPASGSVRSKRQGGRGPIARLLVLTMAVTIGGWVILGSPASSAAGETRPVSTQVARASTDCATAEGVAAIRASARTEAAAVFPLSIKPGERYLIDAAGRPFLIQGDTAWSLIAQLTRADIDLYLDDRRARGFNTILVSLIEAKFATNAPANAYGQPPFLKAGQYDTPNEAYFQHADWVLRRAAEKGFLVMLTPSYLGYDGWFRGLVCGNGGERAQSPAPVRRIFRPALSGLQQHPVGSRRRL